MSNFRGKKRRNDDNTSSTKSRNLRSKKECYSEACHLHVTVSSTNEIIEDKTISKAIETEVLSLNYESLNVTSCITNCNETNEPGVDVIESFQTKITNSKSSNGKESKNSKVVTGADDVHHCASSETVNKVDALDPPARVSHTVPMDLTCIITDDFLTTEQFRGNPLINPVISCNLKNHNNCAVQASQDKIHLSPYSSSELPESLPSIGTTKLECIAQTVVIGSKDKIKDEDITNAAEISPLPINNIHLLSSITESHQKQHSDSKEFQFSEASKVIPEDNSDNRHNPDNSYEKMPEVNFANSSPCHKDNGLLADNVSLNGIVNGSSEQFIQGKTIQGKYVHIESNLDTNVSSLTNINQQITEQQNVSEPDTIVKNDNTYGDRLHQVSTTDNSSLLSTSTAANEAVNGSKVSSEKQFFTGYGAVEKVLIKMDSNIKNVSELVDENIGANDTQTCSDLKGIMNLKSSADDIGKSNRHSNEDVIGIKLTEDVISRITGHSPSDVVQTLDEGVQCVILKSIEVSKSTNIPVSHPNTSRSCLLLQPYNDQDSKSQSRKQTDINNLAANHCDSKSSTLDNEDNLNKSQLSLNSNKNYHTPNTTDKECLEDGTCISSAKVQEELSPPAETYKDDVSSEWSDSDMCQVSTQNFMGNHKIENDEKEAIEITEFENSFASSQRQCRELVDKKRQKGSHFVSNIVAQLKDINQQLMMMKKQIEIVKREMANNQPTQHVSKFFSKTNSNFSFFK